MGGTGLEPVTPSLSIRSSVRDGSPRFANRALLSQEQVASERLSERERTLSVAIVATSPSTHAEPRGSAWPEDRRRACSAQMSP
jgi:hypothetical protein